MAAEKIGPATCPLCGGTASVSLSKKLLPVLTCNGCNIQMFARSDRSDDLVRKLLKPKAEAPAAAPSAPAAAPVAEAKPAAPAPAAKPVPEAPPPAPVTEKPGIFGLIGG